MMDHDYRELRRQASSTVSAAGVPDTASFEELHRFMETVRGRRIAIAHLPSLTKGACGLWVNRQDTDMDIVFCDTTSRYWKQTVYHEWGHMLLGHGEDQAASLDLVCSLVPLLPAEAVRFALARDSFDTQAEAEAEAVGDVLGLLVAKTANARRKAPGAGFGSIL